MQPVTLALQLTAQLYLSYRSSSALQRLTVLVPAEAALGKEDLGTVRAKLYLDELRLKELYSLTQLARRGGGTISLARDDGRVEVRVSGLLSYDELVERLKQADDSGSEMQQGS